MLVAGGQCDIRIRGFRNLANRSGVRYLSLHSHIGVGPRGSEAVRP